MSETRKGAGKAKGLFGGEIGSRACRTTTCKESFRGTSEKKKVGLKNPGAPKPTVALRRGKGRRWGAKKAGKAT